jgi:hypothetical protein
MVWLAGFLGLLEFLEFIVTPLVLTLSVTFGLYILLAYGMKCSLTISAILSGFAALKIFRGLDGHDG